MSYTIKEFERDIKEILEICQEDLKAIEAGESRQATKEQIEETIIPEMHELLEIISKNELPKKNNERWIESSAMITRGWNWDIWSQDKLNLKLPVLDSNYRFELP